MTPSFTPARNRTLNWIDAALEACTVLSLGAAIAVSQANVPCALYLLALPVATITVWACSGLIVDRQSLREA